MELHDWKDRFASRILGRGEDYYYDDAVRAMKWDGKRITATVSGTESYQVKIDVSNGVVGDMSCTCPYAADYNCKHMAAVLLAASEDDFPGENSNWTAQSEKAAGMSLEDAVQTLSDSDAKALLLRCAKADQNIADQILFKATGGVSQEQIRHWMKQIPAFSRQYSDRHGFIEYAQATPYTEAIAAFMDEKISLLLDADQPWEAFALTCKVCEEIKNVDIDDSNGGIGWLYWECTDHWREILPRMNPDQRHKMFDWIQKHYHHWNGYDDPFDEFLFGSSGEEAAFQEPEFLKRKLELLDKQIAAANEDSYHLQHCVMRRLDIMRQLSVSREETERFMQKYTHLPFMRQYLIKEAIEKERFDDAIDDFLFGSSAAAFQEPEFLRRKLELLDEQIATANEDSYHLQHCVMRRLDIMRQLSVSREETERFIQKYTHLPFMRQYLIKEAVEQERFDDAISLLRQSKKLDAKYTRYVGEYSDKLIEIFQKLNRTEELREELLFQLENVDQDDLKYVNLLKSLTPPEEWPELREELFSMRGVSWVDGELMEQEGMYQRLLAYVLQSRSLSRMEEFFETLKREYPDETRKFYVTSLRSKMRAASDRKAYAECAELLKKLSGIRGGQEAAAALADEWRKTYPRHRAMLDELKKHGF